jgi:myosin heavy subunit
MSKVKLHITSGDIFVQSNGKKKKVEAKIPDSLDSLKTLEDLFGPNTVPIHNNDIIITEEDSYAINIQDENDPDYTVVSLFPNSKAKLRISDKQITEVELMNGLFRVETKNPIRLPLAKIEYIDDSTQIFFIEVKENKVSVSIVSGYSRIQHEELNDKAEIQMQEQVNLTPSSIEGPMDVDQKLKNAYKKQREFEAKFYGLFEDASILQQKVFIADMEKSITEYKQDIRELEEDGGSAPTQMKIGLQQLKKQLKDAKQEFREELSKRSQKEKKEKEQSEFQKKFEAREKKFQEDLAKMSQELSSSSEASSSKSDEEKTELEKKIQAAGEELEDLDAPSADIEGSDEEMTELEKKIQAAGEELEDLDAPSADIEGSDEEMTELEKKIQAAGEELEDLDAPSADIEGSDEEMTELEKKIQAAGEELEDLDAPSADIEGSDEEMTELEKKIQAAGEEMDND